MPMCQSSALTRLSHSEVNVAHGAQPGIGWVANESWVRSESWSGGHCLNPRPVDEQGKTCFSSCFLKMESPLSDNTELGDRQDGVDTWQGTGQVRTFTISHCPRICINLMKLFQILTAVLNIT